MEAGNEAGLCCWMTENYSPGLMPSGESWNHFFPVVQAMDMPSRKKGCPMRISGNKGFAAEETKVRHMAELPWCA